MRFGTVTYVAATALAAALASVMPQAAKAGIFTMTFEEFSDTELIGAGYDGGTGSAGGAGPNYGVTFSPSAYASTSGGSGNFTNNPSPPNALAFMGTASNMMTGTFTNFVSFYYASDSCTNAGGFVAACTALDPGVDASVEVLGSGGTVLASQDLPDNVDGSSFALDDFSLVTLDFSGVADEIVFDNVTDPTFGYSTTYFDNVSTVPEPASLSLLLVGLGATGILRRRRSAKK